METFNALVIFAMANWRGGILSLREICRRYENSGYPFPPEADPPLAGALMSGAEGAGLEPARAFAHWFSRPAHCHSANPPPRSGILPYFTPKKTYLQLILYHKNNILKNLRI